MLKDIIGIAKEAGKILMKYYSKDLDVQTKSGKYDLLTQADLEADSYIRNRLKERFPKDNILSEESSDIPSDFSANVWMVDPLDGTKEFVKKGTGFSVMIGFCKNGIPTMGVVFAPVNDLLYYAVKDKGAYVESKGKKSKLQVSDISDIKKSKMVTRIIDGEKRDLDTMINLFPSPMQIPQSSIGLKLGLIAEQKADVCVNSNYRCSKWDTCAPQIILEEAGGKITDFNGEPLNYKQRELKWENSFIASSPGLHKKLIEYIKDYFDEQQTS